MFLNKWKKMPGYMSCYTIVPKTTIKWSYTKLFLRYKAWECNFSFSFWDIFCPFTLLTTQKNKLKQKWRKKISWRYHHFTHMYQKLWSQWFLKDMVREGWADRQADRKSDNIDMSVPPKKLWQVWKSPFLFLTNLDM